MTARVRIHYHRPDRGTTVFEEHVVLDEPAVKVTLLDHYDGNDAFAGGRLILSAGAPVVWFVYPDLCHRPGGSDPRRGTSRGTRTR